MQIYREQASVHAAFLKFFEVKIAGIIKKYRYLQSFQMLWLKEKNDYPILRFYLVLYSKDMVMTVC